MFSPPNWPRLWAPRFPQAIMAMLSLSLARARTKFGQPRATAPAADACRNRRRVTRELCGMANSGGRGGLTHNTVGNRTVPVARAELHCHRFATIGYAYIGEASFGQPLGEGC